MNETTSTSPAPADTPQSAQWMADAAKEHAKAYVEWVNGNTSEPAPSVAAIIAKHYSAESTRVRALEQALAFYADDGNWLLNGPLDPNGYNYTGGPAKAALSPGRLAG